MPTEIEFVNYKQFVENLSSVDSAESTDKSVVCNPSDGPRKFDASRQNKLDFFVVVDNPEYLYAVVDKDGRFLFGVKKDGSFEWAKGLPQKVQEAIEGVLNTILEDMATIGAAMLLKVDKEAGKSLIDSIFAAAQSSENNPEYVYALCDNGKYLLFSIGNDGKFTFHTKLEPKDGIAWNAGALTELEVALRENGFTEGNGDWSEKKFLNIPKPKMAIIDFSNISAMPTTKTDDLHGVMRFWDMDGNFFKKNVIMNAQGNSSLNYEKKNVAIDICNDGWIGDDTFKLKIGEWVEQDSFHLKAYFTDFFRGVAVAGYEIYDQILRDRGPEIDRTWKMANVNLSAQSSYAALGVGQSTDVSNKCDFGARCFPDGFPCAVYLNGEFYGLFQFQLKKHRDNYMMNKDNPSHIHLDGVIGAATFFGGVVDWTAFEIRNPKNLWTTLGTKYDGDNPTEIVGSEDAEAWISDGVMPSGTAVTAKIATQLRNTAAVKQSILNFSLVEESIHAASTTEEKKEIFNSVYNLDNLIDYQIFGDVTHNVDGFNKNWQWTTWNGSHWFVNAYDLDMVFGGDSAGQFIYKPATEKILQNRSNPCYYAVQLYGSEVEARYKELRDKGIVSVKNFVNLVANITKKFGVDFYKKEYEKWTNVPCNRNIVVSDKWELVVDGSGNPVITESGSGFYNAETAYSVGDTCVYNRVSSASWFYTFKCKESCTGVAPAILGFVDSMWRLEKWVEETISNMDSVYNY